MTKTAVIILSIFIVLCIIAGAFLLYTVNSPEYALSQTIKDVKESGLTALEKHLTSEAYETVETVMGWTENSLVSGVISLFSQDDAVNDTISLLKEKFSEINWTVENVLKGKQRADVVLGFDYNEQVIGTIEITMIRQDGRWKIDGVGLPSIDKFTINE